MASQRSEFYRKFYFSPLISRWRCELDGNFVIYTKSPSSAIHENGENQDHFAKHGLAIISLAFECNRLHEPVMGQV